MNAWDTGRTFEDFAAWRNDHVIVPERPEPVGQLQLFDGQEAGDGNG